jgi:hypothetical protein
MSEMERQAEGLQQLGVERDKLAAQLVKRDQAAADQQKTLTELRKRLEVTENTVSQRATLAGSVEVRFEQRLAQRHEALEQIGSWVDDLTALPGIHQPVCFRVLLALNAVYIARSRFIGIHGERRIKIKARTTGAIRV